ncbi:MAG: PAS domain S-box protein [Ignavibacteriales bacterium]|nr:PAS domain S-box protein [Ignavibacteriales bacterium]
MGTNSASIINFVPTARGTQRSRLQRTESRHQRSLLALVWDNSRDGMCLTDAHGFFVKVNPAFCNLVGKSQPELIGRNVSILWTERPAAGERIQRLYEHRFRSLKESSRESKGEHRLILSSGEMREIETTMSIGFADNGERLMLSVIRDITKRKTVERELLKSEKKYHDLFDFSVQPMFRSTPDGLILDGNRALLRLLGFESLEELKKIDLSNLYDNPDDRVKLRRILEKTGMVANIELHLRRTTGEPLTVVEYSRAIRDDDGNVIAYEGVLEDITTRKMLEEQVQQHVTKLEFSRQQLTELNTHKNRLFSILSHDLRSPFSSILGFCDILLNEADLSEQDRHQFLKYIQESAQDQLNLVNRLLDWSRLDTGRVKMEIKELDLAVLAQRCVNGLLGLAKSVHVHVESRLPERVMVQGDEQLLQQVFNNLIGNALKFTPHGGSIVVALRDCPDNHWEVEVKDTGVGIPDHDLQKLFKVGERYSKRGLHGEKGTGLGLPMVYEIVHKHHGHIDVESEVGKGTTFVMTLPNPFADAGSALLVVDDEEGVRVLHSRFLSRAFPHTRILFASDGQEAMDVVRVHKPKFIISDYSMPVMNGEELIKKVKANAETSSIPVVIITGVDSCANSEALMKAGATEVLQKPITPEQLVTAIQRIVSTP